MKRQLIIICGYIFFLFLFSAFFSTKNVVDKKSKNKSLITGNGHLDLSTQKVKTE